MNLNSKKQPIALFDSGVGGLTVLNALKTHLPQENFIYLGDTARVPYGSKSQLTVQKYAVSAFKALIEFKPKLIVIACNTASCLALSYLKLQFPNTPIIGVIEPGVQKALSVSNSQQFGIIATASTIAQQAYQIPLSKARPKANIFPIAANLLVGVAEEGWQSSPIAKDIIKHYLQNWLKAPNNKPDTVILGCTHFPILKPAFRHVLGPDCNIVDSASTTANNVANWLTSQNLLNNQAISSANTNYLVTDSPERFARIAEQMTQCLIPATAIKWVDLPSPSAITVA